MALGVLGRVEQQAQGGAGQSRPPDLARLGEGLDRPGAELLDRAGDSVAQALEELRGLRGRAVLLGGELAALGLVERAALGIGEEAADAARDVAEVEGQGGGAAGARLEKGGAHSRDGSLHVLLHLEEGVGDGLQGTRNSRHGAAQPGLGLVLRLAGGIAHGPYTLAMPTPLHLGRGLSVVGLLAFGLVSLREPLSGPTPIRGSPASTSFTMSSS